MDWTIKWDDGNGSGSIPIDPTRLLTHSHKNHKSQVRSVIEGWTGPVMPGLVNHYGAPKHLQSICNQISIQFELVILSMFRRMQFKHISSNISAYFRRCWCFRTFWPPSCCLPSCYRAVSQVLPVLNKSMRGLGWDLFRHRWHGPLAFSNAKLRNIA